MPRQDLRRAPEAERLPRSAAVELTRLLVVGGAAAMTAVGAFEMFEALSPGGMTLLEWAVLGLFVALFAWIALAFTSAVAGSSRPSPTACARTRRRPYCVGAPPS